VIIYISHRGNLEGRNPEKENSPEYIKEALDKSFDVEIDVWCCKGNFYLGHDEPTYKINKKFLDNPNFWVHAKNIEALTELKDFSKNVFYHDKDDAVLTSSNFVWTYPGKLLLSNNISVLPEVTGYDLQELKLCYAICTDFPIKIKKELEGII
jgi:hypothetical protein